MSNYSNGRMEVETAALGGYRVLSHDRDDQGDFTEVVAECYRLDNARMAAAAPDLLAALEYALKDMEGARDWVREKSPMIGVLAVSIGMARAAIAKATGA